MILLISPLYLCEFRWVTVTRHQVNPIRVGMTLLTWVQSCSSETPEVLLQALSTILGQQEVSSETRKEPGGQQETWGHFLTLLTTDCVA